MRKIIFILTILLTFALVGCSSGQSAEPASENNMDNQEKNEQASEKQEYDEQGYDKTGYDKQGFDKQGYDKQGFNKQGFDKLGYDNKGFDKNGFNEDGYDKNGYNENGYDKQGYDEAGYDLDGYDKNGLDRSGYSASYYEGEANDAAVDEAKYVAEMEKQIYLDTVLYADDALQSVRAAEYDNTSDYEEALSAPYELWDNELNRIYGLLKEKLSTQEMDALRVEQRAWIKTRDKDSNPDLVGTLEEKEILNEYTKDRTLYLIDLYFD